MAPMRTSRKRTRPPTPVRASAYAGAGAEADAAVSVAYAPCDQRHHEENNAPLPPDPAVADPNPAVAAAVARSSSHHHDVTQAQPRQAATADMTVLFDRGMIHDHVQRIIRPVDLYLDGDGFGFGHDGFGDDDGICCHSGSGGGYGAGNSSAAATAAAFSAAAEANEHRSEEARHAVSALLEVESRQPYASTKSSSPASLSSCRSNRSSRSSSSSPPSSSQQVILRSSYAVLEPADTPTGGRDEIASCLLRVVDRYGKDRELVEIALGFLDRYLLALALRGGASGGSGSGRDDPSSSSSGSAAAHAPRPVLDRRGLIVSSFGCLSLSILLHSPCGGDMFRGVYLFQLPHAHNALEEMCGRRPPQSQSQLQPSHPQPHSSGADANANARTDRYDDAGASPTHPQPSQQPSKSHPMTNRPEKEEGANDNANDDDDDNSKVDPSKQVVVRLYEGLFTRTSLVGSSNNFMSAPEITAAEWAVSCALEFRLHPVTSASFLREFVKLAPYQSSPSKPSPSTSPLLLSPLPSKTSPASLSSPPFGAAMSGATLGNHHAPSPTSVLDVPDGPDANKTNDADQQGPSSSAAKILDPSEESNDAVEETSPPALSDNKRTALLRDVLQTSLFQTELANLDSNLAGVSPSVIAQAALQNTCHIIRSRLVRASASGGKGGGGDERKDVGRRAGAGATTDPNHGPRRLYSSGSSSGGGKSHDMQSHKAREIEASIYLLDGLSHAVRDYVSDCIESADADASASRTSESQSRRDDVVLRTMRSLSSLLLTLYRPAASANCSAREEEVCRNVGRATADGNGRGAMNDEHGGRAFRTPAKKERADPSSTGHSHSHSPNFANDDNDPLTRCRKKRKVQQTCGLESVERETNAVALTVVSPGGGGMRM